MPTRDKRLDRRLALIGDHVRAERVRQGLSQEALADAAGLHRTYIGSIERGERNLAVGNLFGLVDALGVDASELLAD